MEPSRQASALPLSSKEAPSPSHPDRPRRQPGWRSVDVLRAAALVMGLYLALRLVWLAHPLLLTVFLGVLFGIAVARGADRLERLRIPRGAGAALIVLSCYGALFGIVAWAAPTLQSQFGELRKKLPEATDRIDEWLERHKGGMVDQLLAGAPAAGAGDAGDTAAPTSPGPSSEEAEAPANPPSQLRNTLTRQLGAAGQYFFQFLSSTVAVLAGILLITFIAIFIGADPGLYRRGLLHLVPHRARGRAGEVMDATGVALRRWLLSQLIAMAVIGAVTTIVLMLLGVKAALSLGIIAGLLEFIPNIGPLVSAVPAVAMGFLDSPQKALLVAIAYIAIQFLENHLLIPFLMKEGVDLPPVLTLIGQALMALVFGFLGLLVAVPLLAVAMVIVKMLYVEGVVGDDLEILGEKS